MSIKSCLETGNCFEYEAIPTLCCKNSVKLVCLNPKTTIASMQNTYLKIYSIFESISGLWWSKHEFRIYYSYLQNVENFLKWMIDNHYKLNHLRDFRRNWVCNKSYVYRSLYLLKKIKKRLSRNVDFKDAIEYSFKTVGHFAEFAGNVCFSIGLGYEFRNLIKEMPITFKQYKSIQYTSKCMFYAAVKMNICYDQSKLDDVSTWLDN